ncbi:hypothetical protein SAMN05443633_102178 [Chryseobacterium arachidis]|uniref:Uncharacterized protein n=2 Tax=Chryseobacterium arachidis TaxID=1416778 RepID=A0A1M4WYV1_9FLAO|nr:hypothetical protein [Chryseobacterium arachidis]SHE86419.1 hypothetical protein SAMN05443633_102178 [Chryseobacterium arachidis]
MKKKNFTTASRIASMAIFCFSTITFAQVGVNTASPGVTFDIQAKNPTNTQSLEGVIAPRLLGSQLSAKSYTSAQTGAIVYITDTSATLSGQTINVNAAGYYYFDGTVWKKMLTAVGNNSWMLADTAVVSKVNGLQNLILPAQPGNGPYELITSTTLVVTVPANYSQNRVIVRWDVWGSTSRLNTGPSQGNLRFAVRQQLGSNTATEIPSIMMSGWVNAFDTNEGPRWNAPVTYTANDLPPGTYTFELLVHREGEQNGNGAAVWGVQGKADVLVK